MQIPALPDIIPPLRRANQANREQLGALRTLIAGPRYLTTQLTIGWRTLAAEGWVRVRGTAKGAEISLTQSGREQLARFADSRQLALATPEQLDRFETAITRVGNTLVITCARCGFVDQVDLPRDATVADVRGGRADAEALSNRHVARHLRSDAQENL